MYLLDTRRLHERASRARRVQWPPGNRIPKLLFHFENLGEIFLERGALNCITDGVSRWTHQSGDRRVGQHYVANADIYELLNRPELLIQPGIKPKSGAIRNAWTRWRSDGCSQGCAGLLTFVSLARTQLDEMPTSSRAILAEQWALRRQVRRQYCAHMVRQIGSMPRRLPSIPCSKPARSAKSSRPRPH
jgi:hypothetical protein